MSNNNDSLSNEIKQTLWKTADKLRSTMSPSEYKHVVLGLIFLKYISDSFEVRRSTLENNFRNPDHADYEADEAEILELLEEKDYYTMDNIFFVPSNSRWQAIQNSAKQAGLGKRIDDALLEIENENQSLKGILNRNYARLPIEDDKLAGLIDLISTIGFNEGDKSTDILGQVYEYFLGQFASAEGKRGGEFYTSASIVKTLVEVLAPYKGKIYDPCCGSGGMFVQSEKFIKAHGGKIADISIYGQEMNSTTWKLAAMNLAIRGIDYNLGREPQDSFFKNQHPDLRADFIMANPPFNVSDWGGDKLESDNRWKYGTPPAGNANFAWIQHMIHHLNANGRAGIVLANGSMSSTTSGEGEIRKSLVEGDVVECMVALPGQLFFNTQIPVCLWFLAKQKKRKGEVLFIDARNLGEMETRVQKVFSDSDISEIANTYHNWAAANDEYEDIKGFCKSASLADIESHDFVLTPGRYVGVADEEDDGIPFEDKMRDLTQNLKTQFETSAELELRIKDNLSKLGYAI